MLGVLLSLALQGPPSAPSHRQEPRTWLVDSRTHYDVDAYRLDLRVDPRRRELEGVAAIELRARRDGLRRLQLDLDDAMLVEAVREVSGPLGGARPLDGEARFFQCGDDGLLVHLHPAARVGEPRTIAVRFAGRPTDRQGVRWRSTAAGSPFVEATTDDSAAAPWWPCKSSFEDPTERCDRLWVNVTVPSGLVAVANGRLVGRVHERGGSETYRFSHPYPIATWALSVHVGPFAVTRRQLQTSGGWLPFVTYALPEHRDRAAVQFAEVPRIARTFAAHFGPWPYPEAQIAVVESPRLGFGHATVVSYGSTFPEWRQRMGLRDPHAALNRGYDYVLVHELARQWWGNAVHAASWGDAWLHDGLCTYSELVWLEAAGGRDAADAQLARLARLVDPSVRLVRDEVCEGPRASGVSRRARAAWALATLRHHLDDDAAFFGGFAELQARHRHGAARSEDLRLAFEASSGRRLDRWYEEWVLGAGMPLLSGTVRFDDGSVALSVRCDAVGEGRFHVPLDLAWKEEGRRVSRRAWLRPGRNHLRLPCGATARALRIVDLHRVLGVHDVRVEEF